MKVLKNIVKKIISIFGGIEDFLDSHDKLRDSLFNIIRDKNEFMRLIKERASKLEEGESFRIRIKEGIREIRKNKWGYYYHSDSLNTYFLTRITLINHQQTFYRLKKTYPRTPLN